MFRPLFCAPRPSPLSSRRNYNLLTAGLALQSARCCGHLNEMHGQAHSPFIGFQYAALVSWTWFTDHRPETCSRGPGSTKENGLAEESWTVASKGPSFILQGAKPNVCLLRDADYQASATWKKDENSWLCLIDACWHLPLTLCPCYSSIYRNKSAGHILFLIFSASNLNLHHVINHKHLHKSLNHLSLPFQRRTVKHKALSDTTTWHPTELASYPTTSPLASCSKSFISQHLSDTDLPRGSSSRTFYQGNSSYTTTIGNTDHSTFSQVTGRQIAPIFKKM